MSIDQYSYVQIYLAGCVLAFVLLIIKISLLRFLPWLTKDNVVIKNVKKILPPEQKTFKQKLFLLALLIVEIAASWVNVVVYGWQIIAFLLKNVREFIANSTAPEAVKLLRFPLRNNVNISREAVWAHVVALKIKIGEIVPDESDLLSSINELAGYYPDTDREQALNLLMDLKVMNSDVILSVLNS